MNHRQARRSLGSRTARRAGTKTKVLPGGTQSKKGAIPKTRYVHRRRTRLSVLVARKVRDARPASI